MVDNSYCLNDFIEDVMCLAHKDGMSYEDIAAVLFEQSLVFKCIAKAEKIGLDDKILEVVKSVLEEKQ